MQTFVRWCTFHFEIQRFFSYLEENSDCGQGWKGFVPGPVKTRWQLELVLFENEDKEKFLKYSFRSLNTENDKFCNISAHFKLRFHDANDDCVYTSSVFESVDCCSGIIDSTEFVKTSHGGNSSPFDILKIKFEGYVFVTGKNIIVDQRKSESAKNIRSLSKDMRLLYKDEQQTDLEMRLKDGRIKAHKTILCARSRYFAKMLQDPNKTLLELQDAEKGVMDKLLSFIYSGNSEELSIEDYSPFKLQEYAQRFGVEGITRFFEFQKHFSYTKILMKSVDFRWSIDHCNKHKESLISPDFQSSDDSLTVWNMALSCPVRKTLNIVVKMRSNGEHKYENVNCTLSLLDGYGLRSYKKHRIVQSIEMPTEQIWFRQFIQRKHLARFNKGGVLNFHCSLSYVVKSTDSSPEDDCPEYDTLGLLSEDYRTLLRNGTRNDVDLVAGYKVFEAHRLVLSARSPVFSAMFRHDMLEKKTGVVVIEDIEPDVVDALLHFIYSGKVDESFLSNKSVALYYAADKYAITSLTETCAKIVRRNLNIE